MEILSSRLELLQDEILNLYEQASTKLEQQLLHWQLLRKEAVLQYFIRKKGYSRLGSINIPPLANSQAKAKQAIEMTLLIETLLQSPYAFEEWTLVDISRERVMTEPEYTFKKKGVSIDVKFDGDDNNVVRHTMWKELYIQNSENEWYKTNSKVDHRGIYYFDSDNYKIYYVDFAKESERYSSTGHWDVFYNQKLIMPSVSSSLSGTEVPVGRGKPDCSTTAPCNTTHQAATSSYTHTTQETKEKSPKAKRRRYTRRESRSPEQHRRSRSSSRESQRGERRGRGGRVPGELSTQELSPPSPGQVGSSRRSIPQRAGGRIQRLLQEARDPPALVLKGEPNRLKCVRYRLKEKYSSLFFRVSTTWFWTQCEGTDRVGDARVLVQFTDEKQRNQFLNSVKLPNSIRVTAASFYGM